jgi:hypothetical protein
MPLVLNGATSGSATLQSTDATTTTITMPSTTGTLALTSAVIGIGQTWQDVTASRAFSTTYTNSTGKPIMVAVQGVSAGASGNKAVTFYIDTFAITTNGFYSTTGNNYPNITVIVPNGSTYKVEPDSVSLGKWWELR